MDGEDSTFEKGKAEEYHSLVQVVLQIEAGRLWLDDSMKRVKDMGEPYYGSDGTAAIQEFEKM